MATTAQSATNPTLMDQMRRMDPNGSIASIGEILSQQNVILEDATFIESNLPTGHVFTSRTALPSIGYRRFNEGVAASKSKTDQVTETMGMMEGRSQVDCKLAKLNGNEAAFRASEDKAFLQAFNNEVESGLIYNASSTAPEKYNGLAPRLNATTAGTPGASQIVKCDNDASGSDQTSIWLVCWSPETVFGIFPKGTVGGLQPHDMGVQMVEDAAGNRFRAYETVWNWDLGLVVKDWRYLVRVANIDAVNMAAGTSPVIESMITAYHKLFSHNIGRSVYYVNRAVATFLHLAARAGTANSTITIENIGGKPVTMFLGIPVRTTDGILSTEDAVS